MRKLVEITLVVLGCIHVFSALLKFSIVSEIANALMISPAPVPFSNYGLHTDKFISPNEISIHFADDSKIVLNYHELKRNIEGPTRYRMSFVGADHNTVTRASFKHQRNLIYSICSANGPIYRQLNSKSMVSNFELTYLWPWTKEKKITRAFECKD